MLCWASPAIAGDEGGPPRLAVDAVFFGLGSPVGFAGLDAVVGVTEAWAVDAGSGRGSVYGDHVTVNARRYVSSDSGWARYGLVGASYSTGVAPRAADRDANHDGVIGRTRQVADAAWLNAAFGMTRTFGSGFRYGFEVGLTAIVAAGMRRSNQAPTEPDFCDMICPPTQAARGLVFPAITPLRVGYSF
jgi:hypothetical protein